MSELDSGCVTIPSSHSSVVIKASDMAEELKNQAIDVCCKAVADKTSESQMASQIKKSLDDIVPDIRWHCFVGRVYGCYFTHDPGSFLHLQVGKEIITLFQAS